MKLAVLIGLGALAASQASATLVGNDLIAREYSSDGATDVLVFDFAIAQGGTLTAFDTYSQTAALAPGPASQGQKFIGYVLEPDGLGYLKVVYETIPIIVGAVGVNSFPVSPYNFTSGDVIAHYGNGIPFDNFTGTSSFDYPANPPPSVGDVLAYPGTYGRPSARVYSIAVTVVPELTTMIAGALLLLPFGASTLRVLRRRTA